MDDSYQRSETRPPVVAGSFYPGNPEILQHEVNSYLQDSEIQTGVMGAVMPHAGYMYSGAVAGETVSLIDIPDRVIVLGPNHTGAGPPVSVFPGGRWLMPFGQVEVDQDLAQEIVRSCPDARPDTAAHAGEHSIEVQLPFLHYRRQAPFRVAPVVLSMLGLEQCRETGLALASVIGEHDGGILVLASSDMTHYESQETASKQDTMALERILDLDPEGLYRTVQDNRISMCGVIPATVMLFAANALGATGARLVRYATSGETSGDYRQVVGYAGVVVYA